jgi:Domain of unknown function (DUF4249)
MSVMQQIFIPHQVFGKRYHPFARLFAMLAAGMLLVCCEKDLKLTVPSLGPRLVVNAVLQTNQFFAIDISRSLDIADTAGSLLVKDATVQLFRHGQLLETLPYQPADKKYVSALNRVQAGMEYTIVARHPSFPEARATATATTTPPLIAFTRRRQARYTAGSNTPLDDLAFRFADQSGQKDYYLVRFGGYYLSYSVCLYSADISAENPGNNFDPFADQQCLSSKRLIFKDDKFDGREKEYTVSVPGINLEPYLNPSTLNRQLPYYEFARISEDFYKYLRSILTFENTNNSGPFAEPVTIHTNVSNGLGIFALYTPVIDSIR